MILALCADKGSPGVSTTALALTAAWPQPAILLEADTAGGDYAFWGRRPDDTPGPAPADGVLLPPRPSLLTLAADARAGLPRGSFPRYAQPTRWGIDVIPAPPAAGALAPLRPLWEGVAGEAAAWPGTVIVDLGRFHSAAPAAPLARAAAAVLVLTTHTVEGLYHARDRVDELVHTLGDGSRPRSPVAVVVRTSRRDASAAEEQVAAMLAAAGSPVPVIGSIWDDEASAAALRIGRLGRRGRRGGDLAASAARLVEAIGRLWPDLAPPTGRGDVVGRGAVSGVTVAAGGAGSELDYALVRTLQERVADQMTAHKQSRDQNGLPSLAPADERQLAMSYAADVVARHMQTLLAAGTGLPDPGVDRRLVEAIDAAMYGAGALQELLDDPDIENIDINGCDEVWVTYADDRGKVRGRPVAASDEDLIDVVRTLGAYAGLNARPFTPAHPELDLRLPDGSRLSAVMAASERPLVSVRRNRFPQMFLSHVPTTARRASGVGAGRAPKTLLDLGTVDERLAAFLQAAVTARCNIVIAGATDAGKTTLLRALINCIPPAERLITVERALELGLRMHPDLHWDVAEMEEVLPSADGGGGLSIGQLVRRTRRHNPSRVVVGEVLGPEVVEMISAMSQGNDGSLSTLHARDAADVFQRLATYAAQYEGMPFEVTHALMGSALDLIVFVRKNPRLGGRRTVTEVLEVTGASEGRVTRSRIFTESHLDGRAVRDPEVQIARRRLLADHGYDDAAYDAGVDLAWARA